MHQTTNLLSSAPTLHYSRVTLFPTMPSSSSLLKMLHLFSLLVLSLTICSCAQGPPSTGYYLSSKIIPVGFSQGFRNLWGPQHQKLDQGSLTIWLDSNSGINSMFGSTYFCSQLILEPRNYSQNLFALESIYPLNHYIAHSHVTP